VTGAATFVRDIHGFRGDARLYRLNPPMMVHDWRDASDRPVEWVNVSAVVAMFSGPETYIFEADEAGEVKSWAELDGSFQGALDHEAALLGAGYEVQS
jgi:hypothetical protein